MEKSLELFLFCSFWAMCCNLFLVPPSQPPFRDGTRFSHPGKIFSGKVLDRGGTGLYSPAMLWDEVG